MNTLSKQSSWPPLESGSTLIELMVSITVGAIVVLSVFQVYQVANRCFLQQSRDSEAIEEMIIANRRLGHLFSDFLPLSVRNLEVEGVTKSRREPCTVELRDSILFWNDNVVCRHVTKIWFENQVKGVDGILQWNLEMKGQRFVGGAMRYETCTE